MKKIEQNFTNQLPLLGVVAAGMPIEMFDNIDYLEVPKSLCGSKNFVLQVDGDSMIDDGILNGDYVIAKKIHIANPGDTVIASINGEATLKRYYIGSNGIELHPRNKKYEIIYVNEYDDFQIQGLVQGVFRNY